MSHARELVFARNVTTTSDPPSVPTANAQATPGSVPVMDDHQLVLWFTVRTGDMAVNFNMVYGF